MHPCTKPLAEGRRPGWRAPRAILKREMLFMLFETHISVKRRNVGCSQTVGSLGFLKTSETHTLPNGPHPICISYQAHESCKVCTSKSRGLPTSSRFHEMDPWPRGGPDPHWANDVKHWVKHDEFRSSARIRCPQRDVVSQQLHHQR